MQVVGRGQKPSQNLRTGKSTLAAFEISLRLPQSFQEKCRQFVGSFSTKRALESALFEMFSACRGSN
jgi:hypothetical protein